MIKEIQFQNDYNAQKDANRTGAYVSLRYDTQKKTLSVVDKFGEQKTNITIGTTNEEQNKQKLKEQIIDLIDKDDQFKQFLIDNLISKDESTEPDESILTGDLLTPLTFKSIGNTVIKLSRTYGQGNTKFDYKLNNEQWQPYNYGTNIDLTDGDELAISGNNILTEEDSGNNFKFTTSGDGILNIYGNIMSLVNFTFNLKGAQFSSLFSGCKIQDASKLLLPVKKLTDSCYAYMFQSCSSLLSVPQLPATTLASRCYHSMFQGCTSLTTPPTLPATTLASECYGHMFRSCTSLTSAPQLPATILTQGCYQRMFWECTNISSIILPATTLAQACYEEIVCNCNNLSNIEVSFIQWNSNATFYWCGRPDSINIPSSGTFAKPSTLPEEYSVSKIPSGWTVINKN